MQARPTPTVTGESGERYVASPTVNARQVRAEVLACGAIPYDNFTLPIVSPDGSYIATQTGKTPEMNAVLARPGAQPPIGTRVQIHEMSFGPQAPPRVTTIGQPALLGRSCDQDGFLIESIRANGARWIGKVSWTTGDIEWLVNDDRVNAFASLGPDGRLAWCRRVENAPYFELLVRHKSEPWVVDAFGGDWLYPMWSGVDDGLFVLKLDDHVLDVCYGQATGASAFIGTLQRLELVRDASRFAAYQTLAGHVNVVGGRPVQREELPFLHLGFGRVGLWQPLSADPNRAIVFAQNSLFGVPDEAGYMINMTESALIRQQIENPSNRAELLPNRHVPRPIAHPQWMYLMLSTERSNQIGLTAMRLLSMDGR